MPGAQVSPAYAEEVQGGGTGGAEAGAGSCAGAWQDEALARDGVSREVPCSALKGETVPDSLPATPKSL